MEAYGITEDTFPGINKYLRDRFGARYLAFLQSARKVHPGTDRPASGTCNEVQKLGDKRK